MARFSSHSSFGIVAQNCSVLYCYLQQSVSLFTWGLNREEEKLWFQLDVRGLGNQEQQFIGYAASHGQLGQKAFIAHHQKGILGFQSGPGIPGTGPGRRPLWRLPIAPSVFYKVLSGDKGLCENCELPGRPSCLECLA